MDTLYSDHASTIDEVLAHICKARRLVIDTCQEFSSWVRLRLLENDSAVLRKFGGRSSPRTFLMTVVQRLYLDWRNREWGKWRPSTAARRAGPLAIELERFVLRDRLPFDEAVEHLRARGLAHSRQECDAVWAELPRRPGRQGAGDEELHLAVAPPVADNVVVNEQRERAARTGAVLTGVIAGLDATDHLILRLRFQDGINVNRIAELIGEPSKAMYRRLERLLTRMREEMLAHGVSAADIADLLGSPSVDFPAAFAMRGGNPELGPSKGTESMKRS